MPLHDQKNVTLVAIDAWNPATPQTIEKILKAAEKVQAALPNAQIKQIVLVLTKHIAPTKTYNLIAGQHPRPSLWAEGRNKILQSLINSAPPSALASKLMIIKYEENEIDCFNWRKNLAHVIQLLKDNDHDEITYIINKKNVEEGEKQEYLSFKDLSSIIMEDDISGDQVMEGNLDVMRAIHFQYPHYLPLLLSELEGHKAGDSPSQQIIVSKEVYELIASKQKIINPIVNLVALISKFSSDIPTTAQENRIHKFFHRCMTSDIFALDEKAVIILAALSIRLDDECPVQMQMLNNLVIEEAKTIFGTHEKKILMEMLCKDIYWLDNMGTKNIPFRVKGLNSRKAFFLLTQTNRDLVNELIGKVFDMFTQDDSVVLEQVITDIPEDALNNFSSELGLRAFASTFSRILPSYVRENTTPDESAGTNPLANYLINGAKVFITLAEKMFESISVTTTIDLTSTLKQRYASLFRCKQELNKKDLQLAVLVAMLNYDDNHEITSEFVNYLNQSFNPLQKMELTAAAWRSQISWYINAIRNLEIIPSEWAGLSLTNDLTASSTIEIIHAVIAANEKRYQIFYPSEANTISEPSYQWLLWLRSIAAFETIIDANTIHKAAQRLNEGLRRLSILNSPSSSSSASVAAPVKPIDESSTAFIQLSPNN